MRLIEVDKLKFREGLNVEGTLFVTLEDISKAPTADAEPVRHGHWIWVKDHWECSVCRGNRFHDLILGLDAEYCGRCGAKMDETKGE